MILSIGEILVDMIGNSGDNSLKIDAFVGGAPFNVAFNAKRSGATVGFIGKVGNDPMGKFVMETAKKTGLDYLEIQTDDERNTTLAFVTLFDGERDFAFFRGNTADYNIDIASIDFSKYEDLNIVHLGSLMLSEKEGRNFALKAVEKIKAAGKIFSFDVNFRSDLYSNPQEMFEAYKPFIDSADILKFSDDEILDYTGKPDLDSAMEAVYKEGRLLFVTMGSKGSAYVYGDSKGVIPSARQVKPIDTTGAGDAFFGTVLAKLDGKTFTAENIEYAARCGNESGANATQFKGAIKI